MHPKDADGMANSIDPDQTASSEAVWSWSALFAETYLSQYLYGIMLKTVHWTHHQNEIVELENIRKLDELAHNEPPYLNLLCFTLL